MLSPSPSWSLDSQNSLPPFLFLQLHQIYTLKASSKNTLFIKDRIIKAQTHPQGFQLKGLQTGYTETHINSTIIPTFVINPFFFSKIQTLQKFLDSHPTLKILKAPSGLLITGEVLSLDDFKFLMHHLPFPLKNIQYNFQFSNLVKTQGLQWLSNKFNIFVSDIDASFTLSFNEPPSESLKDLLKKKGLKFSITSLNTPLGILKIAFLALNKTQIKNLDPLLPSQVQWTLKEKIQFLSQIYSFESLTSTSHSQKSSHLSTLMFDQKKSTLHSGGEFAIRQNRFHTSELQWKRYGLFLEILPKQISPEKIVVELDLRLSLRQGNTKHPELTQDQIQQTLILKHNRPYILTDVFTQILIPNTLDF